jgi:hypothetical protein
MMSTLFENSEWAEKRFYRNDFMACAAAVGRETAWSPSSTGPREDYPFSDAFELADFLRPPYDLVSASCLGLEAMAVYLRQILIVRYAPNPSYHAVLPDSAVTWVQAGGPSSQAICAVCRVTFGLSMMAPQVWNGQVGVLPQGVTTLLLTNFHYVMHELGGIEDRSLSTVAEVTRRFGEGNLAWPPIFHHAGLYAGSLFGESATPRPHPGDMAGLGHTPAAHGEVTGLGRFSSSVDEERNGVKWKQTRRPTVLATLQNTALGAGWTQKETTPLLWTPAPGANDTSDALSGVGWMQAWHREVPDLRTPTPLSVRRRQTKHHPVATTLRTPTRTPWAAPYEHHGNAPGDPLRPFWHPSNESSEALCGPHHRLVGMTMFVDDVVYQCDDGVLRSCARGHHLTGMDRDLPQPSPRPHDSPLARIVESIAIFAFGVVGLLASHVGGISSLAVWATLVSVVTAAEEWELGSQEDIDLTAFFSVDKDGLPGWSAMVAVMVGYALSQKVYAATLEFVYDDNSMKTTLRSLNITDPNHLIPLVCWWSRKWNNVKKAMGGGGPLSDDEEEESHTRASLASTAPVLESGIASAAKTGGTPAEQLNNAQQEAQESAGNSGIVKRINKDGPWAVEGQGKMEKELEIITNQGNLKANRKRYAASLRTWELMEELFVAASGMLENGKKQFIYESQVYRQIHGRANRLVSKNRLAFVKMVLDNSDDAFPYHKEDMDCPFFRHFKVQEEKALQALLEKSSSGGDVQALADRLTDELDSVKSELKTQKYNSQTRAKSAEDALRAYKDTMEGRMKGIAAMKRAPPEDPTPTQAAGTASSSTGAAASSANSNLSWVGRGGGLGGGK